MAETILGAGDLVLTGFNFDNPDELAFVPLVNVTGGTKIKFTDNGWQSSDIFRNNEGIFEWTAGRDYSAGEVITPALDGVAFAASGDQILVYQGEDNNPNFIYALNSEGSGWQSDATSSNTSALPEGLVEGESAIAFDEVDNAVYNGSTAGTKEELQTSISAPSNWSSSDSSRQTFSTTALDVQSADQSAELAAGDIAITGFNFDNPDQFSFVTLREIAAGTEIKFTDDGVSDGIFRGNEGTYLWRASQDYSAGTIINPDVSGVAFSSSGDQIISYTGEASNPRFLYAVNSQGSAWQSDATSSNTSALPPGLVEGESAIALDEVDNAVYSGTTAGTKAELLAAISNPANWTGSNSSRQTMPSGLFSLTDGSGGEEGGTTETIVFINEIHYDNNGGDTNEGIELAGTAATDLSGWSLEFYNGNNGSVYSTLDLSGVISDQQNGFGTFFFAEDGIQNGSPDGVALIDNTGAVEQFLSYEGTITAVDGIAAGLTSTEIGVEESSSTNVGDSLQLSGEGSSYQDFTWESAAPSTYNAVNTNQSFSGGSGGSTGGGETTALAFINEIHYDNDGSDTNEGIELAGLAGTDLSNWRLELYNGNNGSIYSTLDLSGVISDQQNGFGTIFFAEDGIQNGSPDGVALIDNTGAVEQFLSYEGTITAVDGIAAGLTSTEIGVEESSSTTVGNSLQLSGEGSSYQDFTWENAAPSTYNAVNNNQTFISPEPTVFINEFHYDNDGSDTNEGIEIAGTAGTDLSGWRLELYNGNGGGEYASLALSGVLSDQESGLGTAFFSHDGIQNGPDGMALINNNDEVIQFLSYEGTVTAADGTAAGLTSTEIGVSESSSTPVDFSLQLIGTGTSAADFTWEAASSTYNAINSNQTFGSGGGDTGGGDTGGGDTGSGEFTPIYTIQGSGLASPLEEQTISTQGVVVSDFQGANELEGFFIQDATGDGDATTSDGIFVFDPDSPDVQVGDVVEVSGKVVEYYGFTRLSSVSSVNVVGSDSVAPTPVSLPFPTTDYLEQYEGMLVEFPETLTVSGNYNLGRFGEVLLSQGRLYQPTQVAAPGSEANAVQAENELKQILLDDGSTVQNPEPIPYPGTGLTADNTLRSGDTVSELTGTLGYAYGSYRLQPTVEPNFTASNPRSSAPPEVNSDFKVASFNVLNYFNGDGNGGGFPTARGADTLEEFNRQRAKIIDGVLKLDADVVGLMEIENDGYGADSAIQDLVNGLNAAQSIYTYDLIDPGSSQLGSDAIAVGFVYRTETATPVGNAVTKSDGAFSDQNRQPLVQTFQDPVTGGTFTAAVNHFKSKGGSGSGADADQGDGQGNWNDTRTEAANDLTNWLATDPTGSGDSDFLILGDLNAYAQEDPIEAIQDAGYNNLVESFNGDPFYHSYIFGGQSGSLDHALSSSSLTTQVTGATDWHTNTDEPRAIDYNTEYQSAEQIETLYNADPFRASDHDPVLIGLNLAAETA